MRRLRCLRAALFCLAIGAAAAADEQTDFDKGRNAYLSRDYAGAEARFRAMLDPKGERALRSPTLVEHAHVYLGATLMALGQPKEKALLEFKEVLLHNAEYQPDPLTFPTDVLNAFTDAQTLFRREILAEKERRAREERERKEREEREREKQRLYLAALERQAGEQIETRKNSRLLAFVPFGVGQFQNGQHALGWTFLGGEVALASAAILSGAFYAANLAQLHQTSDPNAPLCPSPPGSAPCYSVTLASQYYDRTVAWGWVSVVSWIGLGAVAVGGVVQANVAFVPQTTTVRPRPLPTLSLRVGAGAIGVEGTF